MAAIRSSLCGCVNPERCFGMGIGEDLCFVVVAVEILAVVLKRGSQDGGRSLESESIPVRPFTLARTKGERLVVS